MGLVAAIGTAVTAVAASVGVAVTATALTVGFTTIAAVGAVLGVVGQVTHIKALSYAGLALGAVGGIGALASSAGLLGSGAGLLGEAPTTAAAADAASAGTIDSVAGAGGLGNAAAGEEMLGLPAAGSVEAGGAAGGVGVGDIAGAVKPAAGFIQAADSNAPPDVGHATGSAGGDAGLTTDALNARELDRVRGGFVNTSPVADVVAPGTPVNTLIADAGKAPPPAQPGTSAANTPVNTLTADAKADGSFDGILAFANKNPVVALGALQAAGSFLAGSTSSLTPAQVNQLNSQAAANDAATQLVKQQTANLAAPKAVASSVPVTGSAQLVPTPLRPTAQPIVQPGPAGFINQAPAPGQTGVAA